MSGVKSVIGGGIYTVAFILDSIKRDEQLYDEKKQTSIIESCINNGIKTGLFDCHKIRLVYMESDVVPSFLYFESLCSYEETPFSPKGNISLVRKSGVRSVMANGELLKSAKGDSITPKLYTLFQTSSGFFEQYFCCSSNSSSLFVRKGDDFASRAGFSSDLYQSCYVVQFGLKMNRAINFNFKKVKYGDISQMLDCLNTFSHDDKDSANNKIDENRVNNKNTSPLVIDISSDDSFENFNIAGNECQNIENDLPQQTEETQLAATAPTSATAVAVTDFAPASPTPDASIAATVDASVSPVVATTTTTTTTTSTSSSSNTVVSVPASTTAPVSSTIDDTAEADGSHSPNILDTNHPIVLNITSFGMLENQDLRLDAKFYVLSALFKNIKKRLPDIVDILEIAVAGRIPTIAQMDDFFLNSRVQLVKGIDNASMMIISSDGKLKCRFGVNEEHDVLTSKGKIVRGSMILLVKTTKLCGRMYLLFDFSAAKLYEAPSPSITFRINYTFKYQVNFDSDENLIISESHEVTNGSFDTARNATKTIDNKSADNQQSVSSDTPSAVQYDQMAPPAPRKGRKSTKMVAEVANEKNVGKKRDEKSSLAPSSSSSHHSSKSIPKKEDKKQVEKGATRRSSLKLKDVRGDRSKDCHKKSPPNQSPITSEDDLSIDEDDEIDNDHHHETDVASNGDGTNTPITSMHKTPMASDDEVIDDDDDDEDDDYDNNDGDIGEEDYDDEEEEEDEDDFEDKTEKSAAKKRALSKRALSPDSMNNSQHRCSKTKKAKFDGPQAAPIHESTVTIKELKELRTRGQLVRPINASYVRALYKVPLKELFSTKNPTPVFISTTPTLQQKSIVVEGNHRMSVISGKKGLNESDAKFTVEIGIIVVGEEEFDDIWSRAFYTDFTFIKKQVGWQTITNKLSMELKLAIIGIVSQEVIRCNSEMERYDECYFYLSVLDDFIDKKEVELLQTGSNQARAKKLNELVKRGILHPPIDNGRSSADLLLVFLMKQKTRSIYMSGLQNEIWPTADHFLRVIFDASIKDDKKTEQIMEDFIKTKTSSLILRNKLYSISNKNNVKNMEDTISVTKSIRSTISIKSIDEAEDGGCLYFTEHIPPLPKDVIKKKNLSVICIDPDHQSINRLMFISPKTIGYGSCHCKFVDSGSGRGRTYFIGGYSIKHLTTSETFETIVSIVNYHRGSDPNSEEGDIQLYELVSED